MRTHSALTLTAGLLLFSSAAIGQTSAQPASKNLTFDVASVRPSAPLDPAKLSADFQAGKMPRFGAHVEGSRAEYDYMSLRDLIANAYDVKPYQISGPDWLATERFDIVANMPDGASQADAPRMLQALLADRFKLTAHRETQERPVLALVVGKGGPKLRDAPPTPPTPIDEDAPLKPGEMKVDGPDGPIRVTRNPDGSTTMNMGAKGTMTQRIDPQTQTLHLESSTITMAGFADMLTSLMQMGGGGGRQVVDMTGLKGNYQVAVDVSLADLIARARAQGMNVPAGNPGSDAATSLTPAAPDGGSTLFASIEKLGLKLEPRKASVEQLIVDHIEKTPTAN